MFFFIPFWRKVSSSKYLDPPSLTHVALSRFIFCTVGQSNCCLYSIIWKSNMWGILYYLFPLLVDHLMLYLHVFINLLCGNMFLHNCLSSSITHIIMPQTIYIGSIYFLRQIFHFLYIYVLIFHIFGIMYQNSYW